VRVRLVLPVALLAWGLAPPHAVQAQSLDPAGARALGLAGTGAAGPAGAEAVALNPASLALPGAHRFSVTLLPTAVGWSVEPVGLSDLTDFSGSEIPRATREEWTDRVGARGSLDGAIHGSVTGLALQVGSFGFQAMSSAHGEAGLNEDAVELLLFGNAGRTGSTRDMELEGAFLDAVGTTTMGVSFALPLSRLLGRVPAVGGELAVGVLGTWTAGHFLALGRDLGSRITADPLAVEVLFPVVYTDSVDFQAGSGFGLTLAAAWSDGPWSVAAVIHDAVNTFEWDEDLLVYRPGEALLNGNDTSSDFESLPFARAPEELRALVRSRTPSTRMTLAGAWRATGDLQLFADASRSLGTDMSGLSRTRLGVGAELTRVRWLPLRAGLQMVSGGMRIAGGLGLELGMVELGTGVLHRSGSNRGDTTVGASLTLRQR
jgi:hypothetical protein